MSSSKLQSCLELCRFVHAFLKPELQNIKHVPFGLGCFIHDFLLNRMAYYLRYITEMKQVVCGVSLLQLALTWQ
jgi:hypothetical protein